MTRRAKTGRDTARTYRRASLPATATALLAFASFAGSCSPLPDDNDGIRDGTEVPKSGRRPSGDTGKEVVKVDPCAKKNGASDKANKQQAAASKVLYSNDFESPNVPLVADCGPWLDQKRGINALFGTDDFQFAQFETVEGVLLKDEKGVYTDPSGKGGQYAIGMLSKLQDDRLALSFANDMPIVNVRLDLSGIAIEGCGTTVPISKPRLKVDIYDAAAGQLDLSSISQEPLDSKIVEGFASDDAWEFNWRTAVVPLDASSATSGNVTVVFDLLEGGYAAIDNLSIVASTEKGVVDADNNGVADDTQCAGGGDENADGDADDAPPPPRDAGTPRNAGGRSGVDAGTPAAPPATTPPAATPPPATPPASPPPAATPPAATPRPTTPPASTPQPTPPTSSRDDEESEGGDDEESQSEDDDERRGGSSSGSRDREGGSIIDRLRDAGLFGN